MIGGISAQYAVRWRMRSRRGFVWLLFRCCTISGLLFGGFRAGTREVWCLLISIHTLLRYRYHFRYARDDQERSGGKHVLKYTEGDGASNESSEMQGSTDVLHATGIHCHLVHGACYRTAAAFVTLSSHQTRVTVEGNSNCRL